MNSAIMTSNEREMPVARISLRAWAMCSGVGFAASGGGGSGTPLVPTGVPLCGGGSAGAAQPARRPHRQLLNLPPEFCNGIEMRAA
ncbi:MAG: hypothetical protein OTI36_15050 [Beijerinckiaceae bacterium]|nr:hypothetical protein [Beijerinckiaceae bacterium]